MTLLALLLLLQTAPDCAAPPDPTPPLLSIPEPGLDDTAAYQGYRTRLYRDSHGNAVQIYLDARSGRMVTLLADAEDESVGLTARDARGRPAAVSWGNDSAGVRDSAGTRTIEYRLLVAPGTTLGWFVLGSMRVERDFQYGNLHRRPYTAPPFQVVEESLLVARLAGLALPERSRHLALLGARSMDELRSRLRPTITERAGGIRIERPALDGRSRLAVELRVPPRAAALERASRTVAVRSSGGRPVCLGVRISTTAAPLTPLGRERIFTPAFLDWLARARAAGSGGDTAAAARARRLERLVRSVELLSSEEKLMAGLPNFATYFGRDMLMTALMMRAIWRPEMSQHVIASALGKLGPGGEVSHEEALGGQAIRESAGAYAALLKSRRPTPDSLARARAVLRDLRRTRENYHMLDDEFQLPVVVARWLADSSVPADRKRGFLAAESRLPLLLRELTLVARLAGPYAADPSPTALVGFERLESTRWRSSSWRDSDAGYAGGRYAMDINAIWVPHALEATGDILRTLPAIGFSHALLDSLVPDTTVLQRWLVDSASLARAIETWRGAGREFAVVLAPEEVARRLGRRLAALPDAERRYWRAVLDSAGGVRDSLAFAALALDSAGVPIPVPSTDEATEIFLDSDPGTLPSPGGLEPFLRDYPVGLFVSGLGPVAANDAYASSAVWERWRRDRYHSPYVVWGREVNLLLLGLAQKIAAARAAGTTADPALRAALEHTRAAVEASGMGHNELWSYRIDKGRLLPMRYGSGSDVQLWNTTDLAVQYALSRLPPP
ncbi:MAG TPA: hypothetical protein VFT84_13820 [Gemmatimonadales bacterium]|nr:hypothetical protein [Gemmatimonadales bacterium]